mmetsp:Transcript_14172/g.29332  ORF Transcript_14172/g.29332 Transcript_14172/m.29332 type:complete len:225 (-) Transcript_14172:302-976(-)
MMTCTIKSTRDWEMPRGPWPMRLLRCEEEVSKFQPFLHLCWRRTGRTFEMVQAMRKCSPSTILDLHVCVERPQRYVKAMADAGGNTFIFQWEACDSLEQALDICHDIEESGMECGISINPSTQVEDIYPLLESGLIKVVDILAVKPGFGGQSFQNSALEKIRKLVDFRLKTKHKFEIMVDGGINQETAKQTVQADILVAGTYLFNKSNLKDGVEELEASFATDA